MTYKWNFSELQNYSNEFAHIVSQEHFSKNEYITGSEILNLTKIKQLNLFILKELFDQWQQEASKLQSPYFDFSAVEVKRSLEDFLNVLSRFIKVNKADFEPILAKATNCTLELYLDPAQYFSQQMRNLPLFKLTPEWLKNNGRFFKDYNWVLIELLARVNGYSEVYANEGIDWIHDIITKDKIENHETELSEIEKVISSKFDKKENLSKSSFFDTFSENDLKPESFVNPVVQNTVETEYVKPIIEIPKPVETISSPIINHSITNENIQHTITEPTVESKTLNDNHSHHSLSDFHQKRKIDTIKGNISLNQKFLFINNLFEGDINVFDQAINELETCNTFGEAKEQMIKNYLPRFKWNLQSAEVEEFFDLLKRRFN